MLRLTTYMRVLPGGFWFTETINGITYKSQSHAVIDYAAFEVKEWRKGNSLPRATYAEALADIDAFSCARAPAFCFETDQTVESLHSANIRGGCGGCGIKVSR